MKNVTNWLSIVFLGTAAVLWPFWLVNGYLEDWYPKIGAFIAIYGGFVGSLVWYIQNKKNF